MYARNPAVMGGLLPKMTKLFPRETGYYPPLPPLKV